MTLPKPPSDLAVMAAHAYVSTLPFGAKRWYGRAFLKHLLEGTERPTCGRLGPKPVVEIQARLKEILQ